MSNIKYDGLIRALRCLLVVGVVVVFFLEKKHNFKKYECFRHSTRYVCFADIINQSSNH